jgi:hypothetical protein
MGRTQTRFTAEHEVTGLVNGESWVPGDFPQMSIRVRYIGTIASPDLFFGGLCDGPPEGDHLLDGDVDVLAAPDVVRQRDASEGRQW